MNTQAALEAARSLRALEREFDALPWQDRSAVAVQFCEDQIAARVALDAALAAPAPWSADAAERDARDTHLRGIVFDALHACDVPLEDGQAVLDRWDETHPTSLTAARQERDDARGDFEGLAAEVNETARLSGPTAVDEVLAVYMAAKTRGGNGFSCDVVDEVRSLAAARQREQQLTKALARACYLAEHLHAMVPRQVWLDSGGDDGQGHYEGDYRAEGTAVEIADLTALAGEAPPTAPPESGSAKNAESAPDGMADARGSTPEPQEWPFGDDNGEVEP